MADKVLCDKSDLVNIADAVRSKLGVTNTYYVSELSSAIQSIQTGSAPSLQSKSVTYTENGTATITSDEGYDGLSSVDVTVNVSGGGGYIENMRVESMPFQLSANDVRFHYCGFVYSDVIFLSTSTNLSFTNCVFRETHIVCSQSIRDAIENDSSNTLDNVTFDIT